MNIICPECGQRETLTPTRWRCDCGSAWEPVESANFDPTLIDPSDFSLWRYRRLYGVSPRPVTIRLGCGWTPLLPWNLGKHRVLLKLEYLSPTSSFKDRGTAVMIHILRYQGVTHIAEDSSGNAGASIAAYAAAAGMTAEIFVPAHASPSKRAQISVFGAQVRPIPGPRVNAQFAAFAAVESGITMASHAYHPGFLLGQQSIAWELWEQMEYGVPDWYIVPVGQGVHLLAVWLAFRRLLAAGLVDRLPRLVAVQATRMAPVCMAFENGLGQVPSIEPTLPSVAEGLAITEPIRGRRLLQAIRESGGTCIAVEEEEIQWAQQKLAHAGFLVEPTSATAVAALPTILAQAAPDEQIVLPLTGSGLKGSPSLSLVESVHRNSV